MCVTKEVIGQLKLKGGAAVRRQAEFAALFGEGDDRQQ